MTVILDLDDPKDDGLYDFEYESHVVDVIKRCGTVEPDFLFEEPYKTPYIPHFYPKKDPPRRSGILERRTPYEINAVRATVERKKELAKEKRRERARSEKYRNASHVSGYNLEINLLMRIAFCFLIIADETIHLYCEHNEKTLNVRGIDGYSQARSRFLIPDNVRDEDIALLLGIMKRMV